MNQHFDWHKKCDKMDWKKRAEKNRKHSKCSYNYHANILLWHIWQAQEGVEPETAEEPAVESERQPVEKISVIIKLRKMINQQHLWNNEPEMVRLEKAVASAMKKVKGHKEKVGVPTRTSIKRVKNFVCVCWNM